jgi:putative transcriptional regulator
MNKVMVCKLKDFMEQKNLNISQLAREIDISITSVRSYANNTFSRIDCDNAIKICTYFGATMGEMFEIVSE